MTVPPFHMTVAEVGSRVCLVSLSGELDLYVEKETRDALETGDRIGMRTVVVDLSGVTFMDSTICGILASEANRRHGDGDELLIVSNGPRTTGVLELAGINRVVHIFPTLHEAMQHTLLEPVQQ